MTVDPYCPPDNPADPRAAALEHLVRAPGEPGVVAPLQDLATILDAEGVFTGLGWPDARAVAATVAFDALTEEDPELVLRDRARVLLDKGGSGWVNPEAVARALDIAANVLDTW